jgi:uncharacterized protein YndB with AHSA1/START domain
MKQNLITLAAASYALAAIPTASLAAPPKPAAKTAVKQTNGAKTLTVEKEMAQPVDNVWQALTQSPLIEKWLTKNDFKPVVGHKFHFRADWGVVDGQVLAVKPNKTLSYTWAAYGLKTVVTWTLTPTKTGTHVRMQQSGFPSNQPQYYQGAQGGWRQYFAKLEKVVAKLD